MHADYVLFIREIIFLLIIIDTQRFIYVLSYLLEQSNCYKISYLMTHFRRNHTMGFICYIIYRKFVDILLSILNQISINHSTALTFATTLLLFLILFLLQFYYIIFFVGIIHLLRILTYEGLSTCQTGFRQLIIFLFVLLINHCCEGEFCIVGLLIEILIACKNESFFNIISSFSTDLKVRQTGFLYFGSDSFTINFTCFFQI